MMEKKIPVKIAKLDNTFTPEVGVYVDYYDRKRVEVQIPQFYLKVPIALTYDDMYGNNEKSRQVNMLESELKAKLNKALAAFIILTDGMVTQTAAQVDALRGTPVEEEKTSKTSASGDDQPFVYVSSGNVSVSMHFSQKSVTFGREYTTLLYKVPEEKQDEAFRQMAEFEKEVQAELQEKMNQLQKTTSSLADGYLQQAAQRIKDKAASLAGVATTASKQATVEYNSEPIVNAGRYGVNIELNTGRVDIDINIDDAMKRAYSIGDEELRRETVMAIYGIDDGPEKIELKDKAMKAKTNFLILLDGWAAQTKEKIERKIADLLAKAGV
jgi:hypothetical protein